jgi:LysR family nitrogen assimilation transcriptional regulator
VQLRHLRYFVKIVDAGSISRAATTIHIAQPALSLQLAELEDKLGVTLLIRSARGVRTTAAGQVLYNEAMALLRHAERIPGIVRSAGGEAEGIVTLGMSSTLASSMAGALIEVCKRSLPKVNLRFVTSDSLDLRSRVDEQTLDLAIVFEDEQTAGYSRVALFRQRLFLIRRRRTPRSPMSIRLEELAALPLILPSPPNVARTVLDRAFAKAGIAPMIVAETDVFSGMLSALAAGLGNAVLPRGDFSGVPGHSKVLPQMIEPPLYLTANVIWSAELPLTRAGEEVRELLRHFVMRKLENLSIPGAEPLSAVSESKKISRTA